jgi:phosphatidylserine/phosphatidylglycerophosphate/cardiolipin synthase-like enzyme
MLAVRLPATDLRALSAATAEGRRGLLALRARSGAVVLRSACDQLLATLDSCSPDYLAGALAGAANSAADLRRGGSVDVVWTGPHSGVTSGRLTSAAVVDLIGDAVEEVLLVSYAAQTEPAVAAALQEAVDRDVTVTLLLERPADNPGYTGSALPFPKLAARRLAWPGALRPEGAALHAKLLVVDAIVALIGSANLTGRALERNLECGVLLRGGIAPGNIRQHILRLLETGVLVPVP